VNKPRLRGRVGSVIGEKWRIEKALGTGGMASVYAAVNLNNGFRVAIKILSDEASKAEDTRKRFLREGYFANKVDHEGIVNVMDDGVTEDGALYLIMELLEGETLEERRAASKGKIPFDDAVDIILAVADVLAAAHDAGLAHRDVKPHNVFITKEGRIKLLDFGVAGKRQTSDDATRTGAGYGTPMYMAPEQMTGEDRLDARVDVFALAATMYRILSGEFPFKATSLPEYLVATLRTKPVPLDQLVPEVSPRLAAVVARGLASEPTERYPDARAFAAAINKAIKPERPLYDEATVALGTLKMNQDDLADGRDHTALLRDPETRVRPALAAGVAPPPPPTPTPAGGAALPHMRTSAPPPPVGGSGAPPPRHAPATPRGPMPSAAPLGFTPSSGVRASMPPDASAPTNLGPAPLPSNDPVSRLLHDPQRRAAVGVMILLFVALATLSVALAFRP